MPRPTQTGRKYLTFADGTRSYFPSACPRTVKFAIDDNDPNDQYARLYADPVVDTINGLDLPRYGLGNYVVANAAAAADADGSKHASRTCPARASG